ncbi:DNA cross-link repair 1A protein [Choloepus didactylus]|uniref:DNA cross-link repair 1A protein n=1 Tax=Choloepus didactylus TaxID=27675 RepID=UPI00189F0D6D|nr:DNA cross-link repair 1A protein [Choloepus didactylus]XP_037659920.1 DNA cross-link repair 1A protein [Choloepus didactylus]
MLEDTVLEEDIWEYKSLRKPKHLNNCSENIPESVEKATDGKYQSKRSRNKKRTVEAKRKVKDHETCLGETDSQTPIVSSQRSSCEDSIQPSQVKETTPAKHCGNHKNKQVSPKIRPVYDGYCPNCQVPFSSLLGQTPRWHVFECLDSPPLSDTECPDGLLCTSTIPSHYKRYTHFLLAQSRASNSPLNTPSHLSGGSFNWSSETNSGFLCNLEKSWSLKTENVKNVSSDPLLMTQCLRISQSPTETNKNISFSTNTRKSQQALQFTEFVNNGKQIGVALPFTDELDNQNNSEHVSLLLPENDFSNWEISYSPLQSDEETYDIDEKLDDSQPELFFTESSKVGSLEEDNSSFTLLKNFCGPLLRGPEDSCSKVNSFLTKDKYSEELYNYCILNDLPQHISQNKESVSLCDEPGYATDHFLLLPSALAGRLASSIYQATKAKPDEPEFHSSQSNKRKVIGESAVSKQVSLPLLKNEMPKPFESQGEEYLFSHPTQSKITELSTNFNTRNSANSVRFCKKTLDGMLVSKVSVLNRDNFSSTPTAAKSWNILPSTPKCNAGHATTKVMKQMDIGVYFGLPPKRKEEKLQKESPLKGINLNPVLSPNEKRTRQRKRKAENSLSDLEFDATNINEKWLSMELSGKRAQHQRKRRKKLISLQEGAPQNKSDYLINTTESGTVNLSKDQVFIKSASGGLQKGSTEIPESSNAGGLRKKTCPFYKKIPGTAFTVDAFQYGVVEGCTAYFLTHFHSDHYAGLSKNFTFPVYCSKITGNLLKNKLHVQEQYIHPLPVDTECIVNGIKVVLLDANHCPGAVMILFYLPNGIVILHTGDFRADPSMERSLLAGQKVHLLYLDTTYCSPEYSFPSQQEVIQFAINIAFEAVTLNPHTLIVCGTYSIGKEKVFLAIADVLGSKVGVSQEKYKTLQCLNIPEINSLITTDMCSALVHLLPMMQINFKGLQSHLKKYGGKYEQILAFRPTGWTHSDKLSSVADIIPKIKGNISIYGIPYSEHSSYLEMKRFVQWLKPQKIIPTVNVGTLKSRNAMKKYFKEWKLEAGY